MNDSGKLLLRLALGVLLLLHGIAKLKNGIDPIIGMVGGAGLPPWVAYGAYIGEILAPLLVIIGCYARVGAGLIVISMLFAIRLVHMDDLLVFGSHGGWALELQGMYLFTAIAVALIGPGRYGVNDR